MKMKTLFVLLLAGLFASTAAYADDTTVPKPKTSKVQASAAKGDATSRTPADGRALVKVAATSQQNKMKLCNQQATGKKATERKAFMKACLSKKA